MTWDPGGGGGGGGKYLLFVGRDIGPTSTKSLDFETSIIIMTLGVEVLSGVKSSNVKVTSKSLDRPPSPTQ